MTLPTLIQTHRDAYNAAEDSSSDATKAARDAAALNYDLKVARTAATEANNSTGAAYDRANAEGATLTDLHHLHRAEAREASARTYEQAVALAVESIACAAQADAYTVSAIRTVSDPAANGFESALADAAEEAAEVHAEHAATIAAAEQALQDAEANLVRRIAEAQDVADLDPADVLDVRRAVYVAALNASKARALVRTARLTAALAAADAEAEVYDLAESELSIEANPWTDVANDDADL